MPGRCMTDSIFCIQFSPVMRRSSWTNVWRPQNVMKTRHLTPMAPAVDARIMVAQTFSRSPL